MKKLLRAFVFLSLPAFASTRAPAKIHPGTHRDFYCRPDVVRDLVDSLLRYRNYLIRSKMENAPIVYADEAKHLALRFGNYYSPQCALAKGEPLEYSVDLKDSGNEAHETVIDSQKKLYLVFRPMDPISRKCLPQARVEFLAPVPGETKAPKRVLVFFVGDKGDVPLACPPTAYPPAEASIEAFFNDSTQLPQELFARKIEPRAIDFSRPFTEADLKIHDDEK